MIDFEKYDVEFNTVNKTIISITQSDLENIKIMFDDISEDNIKNNGKALAYLYTADIDLDFNEINNISEFSKDSQEYIHFKRRLEEFRRENISRARSGNKNTQYFYLTYLMVFKYIFDLDISEPAFEVEKYDKTRDVDYINGLDYTEGELKEASKINLSLFDENTSTVNFYISIYHDPFCLTNYTDIYRRFRSAL